MSHVITLEQFEGPLDLLLQLIESEELDISEISLAQVTDQYVQYIQSAELEPNEITDFLSVAARLLLLKSRALLFFTEALEDEEEENLTEQLKMYGTFVAASKQLNKIWLDSSVLHERERLVVQQKVGFVQPKNVSAEGMRAVFELVIKRVKPLVELPEKTMRKVVSLREKIAFLSKRLRSSVQFYFHETLERNNDPHETIVSFLALLELVKQREATVEQVEIFSDIRVKRLSSE